MRKKHLILLLFAHLSSKAAVIPNTDVMRYADKGYLYARKHFFLNGSNMMIVTTAPHTKRLWVIDMRNHSHIHIRCSWP